ncbi:hypothetical protein V1264_008410 [Littorina saxatilis]
MPSVSQPANAFQVLMGSAKARSLPKPKAESCGKTSGLNRKDELYDDVLNYLAAKGADFSQVTADQEGAYFTQVLTNALWYATSHHLTINDRANKVHGVLPIPEEFEQFAGYNEIKRKKIKALQLHKATLSDHAEVLFSLVNKSYMSSTAGLKLVRSEVTKLAMCFSAYANYLSKQTDEVQGNAARSRPCRTVDEHTTVEARTASVSKVSKQYVLLDAAVRNAGVNNPFVFDEEVHITEPFTNNMQRHRFWEGVELSVPIDVLKFSPGGPLLTTTGVSQTDPNRNESEMLTQAARMVAKMRPNLQECHTRAMRRSFREKVKNVAKITPSVVDFIYTQLALDRSTTNNPEMQQRLKMLFLGEEGLLPDLRHLNPGRPSGHFDIFFQKLYAQVEAVTAANDRRHGQAHMSEWISLRDMIDKAAADLPQGTPIPSKSLVRLQFMPTNPYTKTALSFTSKIPAQHKIQRRQLRTHHIDGHYCAALFRYLKHKTVELGEDAMLVCCDDKAKVKVGEPGSPVSTGVRGKESIAPVNTTLVALDHDMTKASVTPSVILHVGLKANATPNDSFVRGKVTTAINDSAFQAASPFRHAAMLAKVIEKDGAPHVLLKYTDGGTDQRNTLESVKCATICLFSEFSFDMVVSVRCAPGQSYINPAERVMSLLNLGLQNCATERSAMDEASEKIIKTCNSVSSIRDSEKKNPNMKQQWMESIEPVQAAIASRFRRLKLKDEPVAVIDPVSEENIDALQRHLRELFPSLHLGKLQKLHTQRCNEYMAWKVAHCHETQYTFQVRKCDDVKCCPKATVSTSWLPEPVLADKTEEHFLPYEEVKDTEPTEKDRPSLKRKQDCSKTVLSAKTGSASKSSHGEPAVSAANSRAVEETHFLSAQTARATAECVECQKPRVVYSSKKLNQRQQVLLASSLSEFEYSCGSQLFPPSCGSLLKELVLRPNITCATPIELPYYGADLGRKDLCAYCGEQDAYTDQELKKCFKTVLPICRSCATQNTPITQRPFGRKK